MLGIKNEDIVLKKKKDEDGPILPFARQWTRVLGHYRILTSNSITQMAFNHQDERKKLKNRQRQIYIEREMDAVVFYGGRGG